MTKSVILGQGLCIYTHFPNDICVQVAATSKNVH